MKDALKLALEALEGCHTSDKPMHQFFNKPKTDKAITAIKEALAQPDYRAVKTYHEGKPVYVSQPEQEPVAWLHWLHGPVHVFLNKDEAMMELDRLNRDYPVDKNARQMKSLYTTPPKRPWVGLTDEERNYCVETPFVSQQWANIEAKLKELNT